MSEMHMSYGMQKLQRGLSLIELMIAMVISLVLLAGVMQIFTSSRATYRVNEQLSRLQENGRFAVNAIMRDARSAGYLGCQKGAPFTNTLNTPADLLWDLGVPVRGFEATGVGTWTPALHASITAPVSGNDVLSLRIIAPNAPLLTTTNNMSTGTDNIVTPVVVPAPLQTGDIAMISDCNAVSVFEVTGYAAGTISHALGGPVPGNSAADTGYAYQAGATVVEVVNVSYFISNSLAGTGPALWRRQANNPPQELLEGVEHMQVLYGVDTTGNQLVNQYVPANAITNWDNVIAMTVGLVVRTPEPALPTLNTETFQVLGTTFDPVDDRRQRMVFTTTATLRNRAL